MKHIDTPDEARDFLMGLDQDALLNMEGLEAEITRLADAAEALEKAQATEGNYYTDDELYNSNPFRGTTSGLKSQFSIGSNYTDEDLEKLRNTIEKDYAENGSIDLSKYFGYIPTYDHGGYVDEINRIIEEMYGQSTGYKHGFGQGFLYDMNGYDMSADLADAIEGVIDGSHANGLSYVPFDNYLANLHEGERVLTRSENEDYSRVKESNDSSAELLEIVKVLKNGFEFIGKKIDSVEVRVQTLEKSARTSQVSSIFARGSI